MNRALLTAATLWCAVACTATYSASYSGRAEVSSQATLSATAGRPSAQGPAARTAALDRSAPQASATPSVDAQRGPQLVANNPVVALALSRDLALLQQKKLPAGRPIAESLGGVLSQGQATQIEVTLQPGRCHAVLAVSPSVSVFTVELTPQGGDAWLARSTDGTAALDDEPCRRVTEPRGARLRLVAVQGAGPVAAQLYER